MEVALVIILYINLIKHTTDWPSPSCTDHHGGTSAAAPIASGIYALVMSIRPDLTWRDFQHLTVETAVPVQITDEDWHQVANGRMYNHKFGYGKLDATRLIDKANNWTVVGPQAVFNSGFFKKDLVISEAGGLEIYYTVYSKNISDRRFKRLEHVSITTWISLNKRGRLQLLLTSTSGYVSLLAPSRFSDLSDTGFKNWTFSSVKHWNEDPIGTWKLSFSLDGRAGGDATLHGYRIIMYGEQGPNITLIGNPPTNDTTLLSFTIKVVIFLLSLLSVGLWILRIRRSKYNEFQEQNDLEKSCKVLVTADEYIVRSSVVGTRSSTEDSENAALTGRSTDNSVGSSGKKHKQKKSEKVSRIITDFARRMSLSSSKKNAKTAKDKHQYDYIPENEDEEEYDSFELKNVSKSGNNSAGSEDLGAASSKMIEFSGQAVGSSMPVRSRSPSKSLVLNVNPAGSEDLGSAPSSKVKAVGSLMPVRSRSPSRSSNFEF